MQSGPELEPRLSSKPIDMTQTILVAFLQTVLAHTGFDLESKIIAEMRRQLAFQMQHCLAGMHQLQFLKRVHALDQKGKTLLTSSITVKPE